jgi:ubiquinone/menaquinone biosynthesis C-methylase UbiE
MSKDLLHQDEVKQLVRQAYAAIESDTTRVAHTLYDLAQLDGVPQSAVSRSLGVNNHLRHANIRSGDTVLDLGCGGGIDVMIVARLTGPRGRAIGLDFLPEMLERTQKAAGEAHLDNVETIEGEMEAIPLPDDSVDYIISNGVINLSPRKKRVLLECARVLRPGGGFCVSDLTIDETQLPSEILTHPAAWAG